LVQAAVDPRLPDLDAVLVRIDDAHKERCDMPISEGLKISNAEHIDALGAIPRGRANNAFPAGGDARQRRWVDVRQGSSRIAR
jgi:hypothetical protein